MSVTTVAALPGLAPLQTVIDSFAFVMRQRRRFILGVLVLGTGLSFLQPLLDYVVAPDVRMAVVGLAGLAVCACLAYLWCRLVLLDEWAFDGSAVAQSPFTWIQFRGFLCYYALVCVGILTLATVLALALAPIVGHAAGGLISGMLFSLLIARLSFVFPATALQLPTSFIESWTHTTGHGLRLWSVYLSAVFPAVIVMGGFMLVAKRLPASTVATLVASFAVWCVGLAALLVVVTMMSIAYERIVGLPARASRLDRMVGE